MHTINNINFPLCTLTKIPAEDSSCYASLKQYLMTAARHGVRRAAFGGRFLSACLRPTQGCLCISSRPRTAYLFAPCQTRTDTFLQVQQDISSRIPLPPFFLYMKRTAQQTPCECVGRQSRGIVFKQKSSYRQPADSALSFGRFYEQTAKFMNVRQIGSYYQKLLPMRF